MASNRPAGGAGAGAGAGGASSPRRSQSPRLRAQRLRISAAPALDDDGPASPQASDRDGPASPRAALEPADVRRGIRFFDPKGRGSV
jgi:hypothetical protein